MQDKRLFHIWELTEKTHKVFSIVDVRERPYEYFDDVHFAISYELNRDLDVYEREVYTSLDWAGNLGGLFEGLSLLFGILVAILNYNYYENYIVAHLF